MTERNLEERLNQFPEIKAQVETLLKLAENHLDGGIRLANDAEERLIQEIRRLGKPLMEGWLASRRLEEERRLEQEARSLHKTVKKN